MIRKRGLIIGVGIGLALVGTALGVVYFRFINLPHPNEASHNQLMHWVVLRDLREHDHEIQLALVNRFAAEAKEIFASNTSEATTLSPSLSKKLLINIEVLKAVWFRSRIDEYSKIQSNSVKEAYLEKQIRLLDDFGNIAFENAKILYPDKADENLTTISDELFGDIDQWLSETPKEKEAATTQAVREATVFWLTTQDLSIQVIEARKELANRVIAELESGMDLQTTTSIVSDERAEKLKANAVLLMEGWFQTLAEKFDTIERKERNQFVDDKIQRVKSWKLLEFLAARSDAAENSDTSSTDMIGAVKRFNEIVNGWVENGGEKLGPKIKKLHTAIQRRMLFSFFNK